MNATTGQTALVQGASRGLGLEVTRQLLADPSYERVVATCRDPDASSGLRQLLNEHHEALLLLPLDVSDATSIARAAERTAAVTQRIHLLFNCAGLLHDAAGVAPEKRLEHVDVSALQRVFAVNAFGPLLVAQHFVPLLKHPDRAVLANVSARVGSIADNRSGGWYAYRGSKAAQNMFTKTLSIELKRRAPNCICVALHPGTVDTCLSRPFQRGVPAQRLFNVERAARQLLGITASLRADESGTFFAWDRSVIPW